MSDRFFPDIAILNRYYIGDSVVLEPTAYTISKKFNVATAIISNYSELFYNHPVVNGYSLAEVPSNFKIVDVTDALRSIQRIGNRELLLNNKLDNIYEALGLETGAKLAPRLYLSRDEELESYHIRKLFSGKTVGVGLWSRHKVKTYGWWKPLIMQLLKEGFVVFVFHNEDIDVNARGLIKIIGRNLRDVMKYLNSLDIYIGVDTGITHIALSLQIPSIVLLSPVFYSLYAVYSNIIPLFGSIRFNLRNISVKSIVNILKATIYKDQPQGSLVKVSCEPKPENEIKKVAVVRIRGLGDVIMLLPALAEYKRRYPERHVTLVTSTAGREVANLANICDEVIGIDYDHGYTSNEPLPSTHDFSQYDVVYNLINKVDFIEESKSVRRIDLFANLLGVSLPKKAFTITINVPPEWLESLWLKLAKYNVTPKDKILVLQTKSNGYSRQWQRYRQEEFIWLANKYHFKVILVNDTRMKDYKAKCLNLTGQLDIREYIALLRVCSCIVSPDSASVHLGGILGTPTIGLFGSVDPKLRVDHYRSVSAIVGEAQCAPCNDWILRSCKDSGRYLECMKNISAKKVMQRVREIV